MARKKANPLTTIAAVAKAFGVSTTTVHNWRRKPDFPVGPPWDPGAIEKFLRDRDSKTLRTAKRTAAAVACDRAKLELLLRRVAKLTEQNNRLEASLVRREEVEEHCRIIVDTIAAAFQPVPSIIGAASPPERREMVEAEARRHLDSAINGLRRRLTPSNIPVE